MKLVVVAGPTGVGKSRLAIRLASECAGEIVNYDSVQVYRGFDIGSAKPPASERAIVPHHLFDIVEATDDFNAADYARAARPVCEDILRRGRLPILVGGTFFYLRALLSGLPEMPGRNEELRARLRNIASRPRGSDRLHRWLSRVDRVTASRVAPADRHRVERALEVWLTSGRPISSWTPPTSEASGSEVLFIALALDRAEIHRRIDARVEDMYRNGLVAETRGLAQRNPPDARPFGSIGYREALAVVRGEVDEAQAMAETRRRTRAYAKRQMTWLRSERNVHWLDAADQEETLRAARQLVERFTA